VQVFKGLINHFYRNRYLFRINELGNLCRYLLRSKRAIYILDNVFSMQFSLSVEVFALVVEFSSSRPN
jgi:hypothetical protein